MSQMWTTDNGTKMTGTKVISKKTLIDPLIKEFDVQTYVCANIPNYKLPKYLTREDNALYLKWNSTSTASYCDFGVLTRGSGRSVYELVY